MGRKLKAKDMKDALRRLCFSTAPHKALFHALCSVRQGPHKAKKLHFRNVRHLDFLKLGCQAQKETDRLGEAVLVLAKFKQQQQQRLLTSKAKWEAAGSHLVHLVTSLPSYLHTKNYLCVTIFENAKLSGILQLRPAGDV